MKAILVLSDSLNRDFLSAYGNNWVQTPNISRFSDRSITFNNHWIGSAPCMPARRDIMTGRIHFLEREWGGLEPFDVPFPRILRRKGVYSHMVTDHYHYFHVGGENYHTPFSSWELVRGQEFDVWGARIKEESEPIHYGRWNSQYEKNRKEFKSENDFPTPKTFRKAINWLKENEGQDDFFLWLEVFDPHEPFDCPDSYLKIYEENWNGPLYNWSGYEHVEGQTKEIEHLRNHYAATITMMDHWFGKLLDELERQGIYEETLIIFTTDHGHMLGEHGVTGKNFWHAWNETTHIPLLVHLPGDKCAGHERNQLTQNVDIMPTILDHFGISIPDLNNDQVIDYKDVFDKSKKKKENLLDFGERTDFHPIHGHSWKTIFENDNYSIRNACLYGWYGRTVNITDGEYTYFRSPLNEDNQPLYRYFLNPSKFHFHDMCDKSFFDEGEFGNFLSYTDYPVLRTKAHIQCLTDYADTKLYNIKDDYTQLNDLSGSEVEEMYKALMIKTMKKMDAPSFQYERLGL